MAADAGDAVAFAVGALFAGGAEDTTTVTDADAVAFAAPEPSSTVTVNVYEPAVLAVNVGFAAEVELNVTAAGFDPDACHA